LPFIRSYLVKNDVAAADKEMVYSFTVKNILWELNEAEKLLGYKMFDATARTLRTGAELFTKEICEQLAIRRGFPDQFKRLQHLSDHNLIDSLTYELLNQARLLGNMSSHIEKSERTIEEESLIELYLGIKAVVHRWISGVKGQLGYF
jgi:hypothetical protein